ncbi:MAG: cupin domain-containing protein [Clostridia bacterium]|nr:cupin domain-containing protein [Clostridia bacterium]
MQNTLEIASRLRELRDACGYSVEQLASELNLDPAVYASYEDDGHDIPISVIFEVANLFKVDFNEILTGNGGKLETYHVVRSGEGKPVDRVPGYSFSDLAFRYMRKIMQPLLVTLDPSDKTPELITHKGQEFNFVVEGSVALIFGDREIVLNKGDSVYFNSALPHGQKCAGNEAATFLTIIAE